MLPPQHIATLGADQLAQAAAKISSPTLSAQAREALHGKLYFSALVARFQAGDLSGEDENFLASICHVDRNLNLLGKYRNLLG